MSSQPFPPLQTSPTWWLMIGKLHTKHIAVIVLLDDVILSWWKVVKCSSQQVLLVYMSITIQVIQKSPIKSFPPLSGEWKHMQQTLQQYGR